MLTGGVTTEAAVCGVPAATAPRPNKAAWNDKSAVCLLLSSLTTGLTGMAGLPPAEACAEVAAVLTGLTAVVTGVCHGLVLDLSLEDADDGNMELAPPRGSPGG